MSAPIPKIILDIFAGGGGASTGIYSALGVAPAVALNHCAAALAMHRANHPTTLHAECDVLQANPKALTGGQPVGLIWFSPDCTHHSRAKGGKPLDKKNRALADVIPLWLEEVWPEMAILENVVEFLDWCELLPNGRPDPARKGELFRAWVAKCQALGYRVEWRVLCAADYGSPTWRRRLFIILKRTPGPIVWPKPTHGPGLLPYRTAAECIDWSIPCPSIFNRKRPLKPATLRRIARGVMKYVVNNPRPFIVPITHHGDDRCHSVDEPLRTITCASRGEFALVNPFIAGVGGRAGQSPEVSTDRPFPTNTAKADKAVVVPYLVPHYGEAPGQEPRCNSVEEPLTTVVTARNQALVAPYFVPRYGEREGQDPRCQPADEPLSTVVPTQNGAQLVAAFLAQHNGGVTGHPADTPLSTLTGKGSQQQLVTAHLMTNTTGHSGGPADSPIPTITTGGHHALVSAFLQKYFGQGVAAPVDEPLDTITSKDRFGLVTVAALPGYVLADIGMRMLTPRELANAQGFGPDYVLAPEFNGKPLTKTAQVRCIGNSVCPQVAEAVVRANVHLGDAYVMPDPTVICAEAETFFGQGVLF
ncbi:MAG: hypothetical protein AMXMBFR33_01690 [Candidatus Xenobia bacterium]